VFLSTFLERDWGAFCQALRGTGYWRRDQNCVQVVTIARKKSWSGSIALGIQKPRKGEAERKAGGG
jgi:hypothetical protein